MRWTRIILGTVIATLALTPAAHAADFIVTGTDDIAGTCSVDECTSIRAALETASQLDGGDRILLDSATYTLTNGALSVNSPVVLLGEGARDTKIVAAPGARGLVITGVSTISHLTVSGGSAPGDFGGNIHASGTTTTLDHVRVTGGTALAGGGIANLFGTMTIENSLIDGNATQTAGGGDPLDSTGGGIINLGGALNPPGALTLRNSTVAFNQAHQAGAIISTGSAQNSLTLSSVTVASNSADAGGTGGIYNDGGLFAPGSSVVANNSIVGGGSSDCGGTPASSQGSNVESQETCGFVQDRDVRDAGNAGLPATLTNAGGETDVLLPNVDSPVVNLRPQQNCEATDQRGVERPKGPDCDAGAVELEYPVRIDGGPQGTITHSNVTFTFSSSQTAVDFECGFSGPSQTTPTYTQCTSPAPYSNLADASHTFHVKAFKNDVEIGEVTRQFTINTAGPGEVTIDSGPDGPTNQTTATFTFSGGTGGDFDCQLYVPGGGDPPIEPCTSPTEYTNLVDGAYTFRVYPAGDDFALSDFREFTVDTVKPGVPKVDEPVNNGIVGAHDIVASGRAENFSTIAISDGAAGQIATAVTGDDGQWQTDVDGLAEGRHDLTFVATDRAGNASDPTTVTTTVDTVDPTVTITKIPSNPTNQSIFDIEFTSEPGATFQCRHVSESNPDPLAVACTSPWSFSGLEDGTHRFEITATDAVGHVSPTVIRDVRIDSVVPDPVEPSPVDATTFAFTPAEPDGAFECRLEGPASDSGFVPCTSPRAYPDLPAGDYRFTLRTLDAAGNHSDANPRTFSVASPPTPVATVSPTPTAAPKPTVTPTPTPEIGETVVVRPVSGKILVRVPGSTAFVALDATKGFPVGTEIDAKNGKIQLTSEPGQGKPVQKATFYGGIFVIAQGSNGFVELKLSEKLAPCPKKKKASAAAAKPKTRKLWGDGKGKFRTRGQYSAATIRGTNWLVQDSCDGTLTRVKSGVVSVLDFRTKKTILVRGGKSYVAKPKR